MALDFLFTMVRTLLIGRYRAILLVAILVTAQSAALAQFGGFGLPVGGPPEGQDGEAALGDDGDGCPEMENVAGLPPAARKVAGEAAQAGNSTFLMMTQGRQILGKSVEETGDTTQALQQIRDEAAFRSLACSTDKNYRMGVCYTFTMQCLAHGGGGCDSCGRHWGNLYCKETLKKIKEQVPETDDVLFDGDSEWAELVSLAEQVTESTLTDDLDKFRNDVLNGAVDGPADELCDTFL